VDALRLSEHVNNAGFELLPGTAGTINGVYGAIKQENGSLKVGFIVHEKSPLMSTMSGFFMLPYDLSIF
jgi:cysteine synthase